MWQKKQNSHILNGKLWKERLDFPFRLKYRKKINETKIARLNLVEEIWIVISHLLMNSPKSDKYKHYFQFSALFPFQWNTKSHFLFIFIVIQTWWKILCGCISQQRNKSTQLPPDIFSFCSALRAIVWSDAFSMSTFYKSFEFCTMVFAYVFVRIK